MVKSDDWFPKGVIKLEDAALEVVKDVTNCLVIAGPGAGKTELLAQKLDYLFSTNKCISPKKILALSFKTDAAANLKDRVKKHYGDEYASRFTSLTYSAFEKKILDQFRNVLPEEIRPSKDYLIEEMEVIKEVLDRNGLSTTGMWKNSIKEIAERIALSENDSTIKNDLLKGTQSNKPVLLYRQITKLSTQIIATNEYIRKALQMTYDFVFLDEFQDTTYAQYNLLKTCFLGSSCKLTAVGDNKQAIMRWAGANPNIFPDYIRDFNSNEYQLLMNHRSVPKLVEFQKEVHQILNSNHSSIQTNNYPEFQEGEITLFEFENESLEAELIADDIKSKIQGGIRPSDICILAKQKVDDYSSKLITTLSSKGIKARIENEYQELLKDPTCNLLLDLISCSQGKRNPLIWENISNFYGNINGIDEFTDELLLAKSYKEIDNIVDASKIENVLTVASSSTSGETRQDDRTSLMLILIGYLISLAIAYLLQHSDIQGLQERFKLTQRLSWKNATGPVLFLSISSFLSGAILALVTGYKLDFSIGQTSLFIFLMALIVINMTYGVNLLLAKLKSFGFLIGVALLMLYLSTATQLFDSYYVYSTKFLASFSPLNYLELMIRNYINQQGELSISVSLLVALALVLTGVSVLLYRTVSRES